MCAKIRLARSEFSSQPTKESQGREKKTKKKNKQAGQTWGISLLTFSGCFVPSVLWLVLGFNAGQDNAKRRRNLQTSWPAWPHPSARATGEDTTHRPLAPQYRPPFASLYSGFLASPPHFALSPSVSRRFPADLTDGSYPATPSPCNLQRHRQWPGLSVAVHFVFNCAREWMVGFRQPGGEREGLVDWPLG